MANRTVSFRLPETLIRAIESEADRTGRSKTEVVIEALTHEDGPLSVLPAITKPRSQLERQIDTIRSQVEDIGAVPIGQLDYKLTALLSAIEDIDQRLQAIEARLG
ncbi:MAG: ribbon-helix-helix protein, CopG family [Cyanobacteria bacterium P01_A01_bin.135]